MNNNINIFLLFNPELKTLNINEIKNIYNKNLITNELVYSFDSFFKKYPDFSIEKYKDSNINIKHLSTINILVDYHRKKNEVINNIKINNNQYNMEINIDDLFNKIDNIIYNLNNNIEKVINNKTLKICHIFVHFFEIGGGETYLSNFTFNAPFHQIIFINKNYNHKTLSKYNCEILYYSTYNELNEMLLNLDFDIILDHQLYWFESNITTITFKNINKKNIIRITHGVPIHFKNINELEYYYSIELYNEKKSDISWNNHIKIYNNIGVDIPIYNKINNEFNKIIIVGRINEEKIPKDFLKSMSQFLERHNDYKFYFYGVIDDYYKDYFTTVLNKSNKNTIYGGIIVPNEMSNIYIENDILMHPSKFEAGATVILEAMSYGMPVIARNTSGVISALNDPYFLCNNEKEMFDKLLLINSNNFNEISSKNIEKIKKYNNKNINLKNLFNDISLINYISKTIEIPNIIHYIYGLKKQTEEFPFIYYISILSNKIINNPYVIFFHYQYEPYGYWWDKIKNVVKLNYVDATNLYWGKKKIIKYAHKADKLRLDLLNKYGGIYMDIDTITYKSYNNLLNNNFVIGIQEKEYGNDKMTLYCNAIMLSKPNNIFIKKWIEMYEKDFIPDGWSESSIFLPQKILSLLTEEENKYITILDKEYFYWYLYNETDKIFESNNTNSEIEINNNLMTLHLWNSFSEKYYYQYNDFNNSINKNSVYSQILKNLINIINKN